MLIKAWDKEIDGPPNATVEMKSGDHLSVAYTGPDGKTNIINLSARHLVFIAMHEGTDTSIICRPGGVSIVN